jgi:hypothetical protein
MPELILVIDDHDSLQEGGSWVEFGKEWDVECLLVVGKTKEAILVSLNQMFQEDPDRAFVGTVLDVIYRGQATGGIELWEELERSGLAAKCGRLLVSTKQDSEEVTEFARTHNAMLNTRLTAPHKKAVFKKFLKSCGLIKDDRDV